MGQIQIDLFMTLDGVAQAPGGPDEDPEGGFEFGGWQAPLGDAVVGEHTRKDLENIDALLLGRKTYDIFAAYWPHIEGGPTAGIAKSFNRSPKYVASRTPRQLRWAHSSLLGPDLAAEVRQLRARHSNIRVIGSLDFVQTLLAEGLYDRLKLWVYPVVLGTGKKLFAGGTVPSNLRLAEPALTSTQGAVLLRYERSPGRPSTGDIGRADQPA
jgi:dihydrofolate reductase